VIAQLALPAALAVALLAPAGQVVDQPWGTVCELAWCQDDPPAPVSPGLQLEDWATAAELVEGLDCELAREARPDLPSTMVVRTSTGDIVLHAWTWPAPTGSTVLHLCYL
jgi:hypothetical protein